MQQIESTAKYIVVVEKDSIFRRLNEDRFFSRIPCILVTACGFPDLATRMMVHLLHHRLRIPVIGLVDFNPFGLSIIMTYKLGSASQGAEAFRYAVPIQWVGLHSSDINELDLKRQNMSAVDFRVVGQLISVCSNIKNADQYYRELNYMMTQDTKVELQVRLCICTHEA